MRGFALVALLTVGCGTRVEPLERGDAAAESASDTASDVLPGGPVSVPPGATPIDLLEGATCSERPEGCGPGGAIAARDALFDAIRRCAPRSVSNVCLFRVTVEIGSSGCVTNAWAVKRPAGIDPSTADAFVTCVGGALVKERWSCLSGMVRPGWPACE